MQPFIIRCNPNDKWTYLFLLQLFISLFGLFNLITCSSCLTHCDPVCPGAEWRHHGAPPLQGDGQHGKHTGGRLQNICTFNNCLWGSGKISIIIHSYSYYPIPMNEQFLLHHLKTFKSGQSINLTSKVYILN